MRLLVLAVSGAAVIFHALFFVAEMGVHVILQKFQKLNDELNVFSAGIGLVEQPVQFVDVIDQLPVLGVNRRRTGRKFLSPDKHGIKLIRAA